MINLLPATYKKDIRAGRSNTLVLRYVLLMTAVIAFVGLILIATYLFLQSSAQAADEQKAFNESKVGTYAVIQRKADSFKKRLDDAQSLFDNETRYSLAILRISDAMPSGTRLEMLELTDKSFGQPITLSFLVTGESAALQLKQSLESKPYFSGVSYGKIAVNNTEPAYPYRLDMNLTIDRSIAR